MGFALWRSGRCEYEGIGGRDGSGRRVTSVAQMMSGRRVGFAVMDGLGSCGTRCVGFAVIDSLGRRVSSGFAVMDGLNSPSELLRSVGFAVIEAALASLPEPDGCEGFAVMEGLISPEFVRSVGFAVMEGLGSWGTRCVIVALGGSPAPVFKGEDEALGLTDGDGAVIFTHCLSVKLKNIGSTHGRMSVAVPGGAQPKGNVRSSGLRTITGKRPEH